MASRLQSGPSAQFVGIQTTCTRNGLGTVIRNRILTLDVDTLMGADHLVTLQAHPRVVQDVVNPPVRIDGPNVVRDDHQCVGLMTSPHPALRTALEGLTELVVGYGIPFFKVG
jgi:hypothetical protein